MQIRDEISVFYVRVCSVALIWALSHISCLVACLHCWKGSIFNGQWSEHRRELPRHYMSRGSALFQSLRSRLQPENYCTAKVHHNFPLSPLKIWIRIHDISYSCRSLLKSETKDEFRCSIKRERLGGLLELLLEQMVEAVEEEVMRLARVVHPLAFRVD